jgi:hypothetical protein
MKVGHLPESKMEFIYSGGDLKIESRLAVGGKAVSGGDQQQASWRQSWVWPWLICYTGLIVWTPI